ncbi:DNA cytosine methyltransferase [Cryobacterium sp. 1639]|uniref:DNA cytosine methyltransferase n=1 Tax=Cryobacterium inferilacus TaxID=2866629 RepID=UPI001C73BD56|nr:DNA cytosine methyltransferase [Cryobacterium sp. 1639]MBX0301088.1 DNA cytosine methyltransferase [Cryobacterium sp. 1639]
MTSRPIRVLDLFAGAGGFAQGFHEADDRFFTVQAVEMDLAAAATYSLNFPNAQVFGGPIQDWLATAELPTDIDVIIGGPPCQGFSTLGKQDVADERNFLWEQYAETIRRTRPKVFIVENVAAFAKSPQFEQFRTMLDEDPAFSEYSFDHRILNSADYGAPQARKRAVMIGHRSDVAAPQWPERSHAESPRTVAYAFAGIPHEVVSADTIEPRSTTFAGVQFNGPYSGLELHVGRDYRELSLKRFAAIPEGGNRFNLPDELLAPCWRSHRSGSGDVMGRMHWTKPSVTVRTEFFKPEKGRYLHPEAHRAITHHEAARLQGFPDDFQFVGSRTAIARQIGNAVPVPLGRAIGAEVLKILSE